MRQVTKSLLNGYWSVTPLLQSPILYRSVHSQTKLWIASLAVATH